LLRPTRKVKPFGPAADMVSRAEVESLTWGLGGAIGEKQNKTPKICPRRKKIGGGVIGWE